MCFSVRRRAQNAPFREAVCAECAFPSRCGAREVWGNPPPGCGALWKEAQLGKCARATTRQPAGRVARGSADLGLSLTSRKSALCPTCGLQNAPFGDAATADCAFPLCSTCRLRFFVRRRHVCPGEEKRILRKDAFWRWALTEKRTLRSVSHGKTHSALGLSRKSAVCIRTGDQSPPITLPHVHKIYHHLT